MKPALAVIDTNVVVAGLITASRDSPTARILDGMLAGRFSFLLSIDLLAEYRLVLLRPKIKKLHRLSEREIDRLLTEIAANGKVQEVGPAAAVQTDGPPDPEDRHLWVLLEARAGSVLVTGDKALLKNPPKWAKVHTPRVFINELGWQT
ncbi:MAG TPA: putative toxin-antitoxin system toxin component, PIN family [Myxococcota bacterium]|nr:putative toxin-antitoxin system toxin component, PIN family [Myxococcota bacterium]